ncbi:TspO/MBR family protein [Psychroflexus maritimus]|uniref:Tryptophan-rich sensory protein n=1 Tax=Psychroflexus maritimus TaxID=2714865 RepID=A0A967ADT3_9FLAO|nr:TspO/MBR family protein [Psychroflexus maritimus]NGZ90422.1 tryptophan-rich sensory protein [Psychroflexus maritimus]
MKRNTGIKIGISLLLCFVVAGIGGYATQISVGNWYVELNKPSFNPPNWVFGPAWTLLYILMGIAAGLVWKAGLKQAKVKKALGIYLFQLMLNLSWSVVFFGNQEIFGALMIILGLLFMIIMTIISFLKVNRIAAYLLFPYLFWVLFASLLNFEIWQLN